MKKIFGIRHHGPGSARSLKNALEEYQPDCVLIEGPPDADEMIPMIANEDLKPPVALLVYNPKAVMGQSSFYPFASFSPEWVAMKYAVEKDLPVRFMDLPLGIQWKDLELQTQQQSEKLGSEEEAIKEEEAIAEEEGKELITLRKEEINRNPIAHLARLANYEDAEEWWENVIEQRKNDESIFEGVMEMMSVLREELKEVQTEETLLREAYMRKIIRVAESEGYERIAIVCGAWHAPVLENIPPKKEDNALLKGKRKLKTESTWIPWTYERLARSSGYGAGIASPAWYEALYERSEDDLVAWWMSRVAYLFRDIGQDASPAHVMEACRLSYALAGLRGRRLPVLNDFLESVKTIFCFGDEVPLQFIKKEMVIGKKMGSIPDDTPQLPLQKEINALRKKYRLKNTTAREPLKIDLREERGLEKSQFLHRLNLLNISYGEVVDSGRGKGTFKELWALKWEPEFEVAIIEAATYGNTIEIACAAFVQKKLNGDINLTGLAVLLEKVFLAELPLSIEKVTQQLEETAAQGSDVLHFMNAFPRLVNLMRYSDVRKRDTERIKKVVEALFPRITVGLPSSCANIADPLANATFQAMQMVNNSVRFVERDDFQTDWQTTLGRIAESNQTHRKLAAGAARTLFEASYWSVEKLETNLSLALSPSNPANTAAAYIEGFLQGGAALLIYQESLFAVLDSWIGALKDDTFVELVPLLRRSFAHFSFPERQQLGQLAKNVGQEKIIKKQTDTLDLNMENVEKVLPVLKKLLS